MFSEMPYRLALDLGSTSLGWAMIRLDSNQQPCAVIKAGVRIFSDGRNPKDGSSLAVTRRVARTMRRRRDRLLKRKARMMHALIEHGLFSSDDIERKALEILNPYELRAHGLDEALTPAEFGRALFHINQRRGFKSNRKTDKKDNDSGALRAAIRKSKDMLAAEHCRTIGEWLYKRMTNNDTVRARYRETRAFKDDGKTKIDKSYDLYVDRAMIEAEFDALWQKQAEFNPGRFNEAARMHLKEILLFQRPLKPVIPGRCTFLLEEERAPLALPSTQRFRIYQEANHLRILGPDLKDQALSCEQRDTLAQALERYSKRSFTQIRKLLGLSGTTQFNFEDPKRQELKGNTTSAVLSKTEHFGDTWFDFDETTQDEIVLRLVKEESEATLIRWLQERTDIDEQRAEKIANASLPEGYGSLSIKALARILPELRRDVVSYADATKAAGFHHSRLNDNSEVPGKTFKVEELDKETGEIKEFHVFHELPYYGECLERHVGFGTGRQEDPPEKRFGKIANPTVHIGLNQVRLVVNSLISRYGHPKEVIVELARDLKQSKKERQEENERQAKNQERNKRLREEIAKIREISTESVHPDDIQKMILWKELSSDEADRRCPYGGIQISLHMLLSPAGEVEIEHILPFSRTLDDSLNNKTVCLRKANRIKGNRTPWEAREDFAAQGWDYAGILERAKGMPKNKRYRFGEDGEQKWLKGGEDKDGKGFLARALNDTRYLSRIAREYVSLICPQDTRVIPGQMTALLRRKFGLNKVLGINGEKNRDDHRRHAVDACVVGVTDQGMLQKFAQASADARRKQLAKLVENMPLPWPTYHEHVRRAVSHIWVSHKPDHSHEGAMHNETAYGLRGDGAVGFHKIVDGRRKYVEEKLKVIEITSAKAAARHGLSQDGKPKPYKGYKGDSNYCIEIVRNDKGKWESEVISTFDAYQLVRQHGVSRLRHPSLSMSGRPLVMRLIIDDYVRLELETGLQTMRVAKIVGNGQVFMAPHNEANVDARNRDKNDPFSYISKMAGSFFSAKARRITISPIGEVRDPGFKG